MSDHQGNYIKPSTLVKPTMIHASYNAVRILMKKVGRRSLIFGGYEDKVAQRLFLARHVIPTAAKRHLTGSKKKEKMMMYHFYSESKEVQVCRLFFLQTLDIKKM